MTRTNILKAFRAAQKDIDYKTPEWAKRIVKDLKDKKKIDPDEYDKMFKNSSQTKLAAIIDPISDTLAPDVWTRDKKLIPEIRKKILTRLKEKVLMERVGALLLIGSLTGYQYNDTSDFDITVAIIEPEDHEFGSAGSSLVSGISHLPMVGRRPAQYYVIEYTDDLIKNYEDVDFGVYDILNNHWINEPPARSKHEDPENRFHSELIVSQHVRRQFERQVMKYQQRKQSYDLAVESGSTPEELKRLKHQAQRTLQKLMEIVAELNGDRKLKYSSGWGIPRFSDANVIYKKLQYSTYGHLLQDLSQKEVPDDYTTINLIDIK